MNTTTGATESAVAPFDPQEIDCRALVPEHLVSASTQTYLKIQCLWHHDHSPSCVVYADGYKCYACGANGKAISLYMAVQQCSRETALEQLARGRFPTVVAGPKTLVTPQQNLGRLLHEGLTDAAMEYFVYERGLSPETIYTGQLGWGALYPTGPEGYTIPVYNRFKLRQVKQRLPRLDKDKYRAIGGAGAWLYLGEDLRFQDQVFLAGGEFDALALRQQGFVATAPTSGEKRFEPSWLAAFEGTTPYCAYDSDEVGELGYEKVRKIFHGNIKRIRLPVKDVTDFFLKFTREDFRNLIEDADKRYGLGR